MESIEKIYFIGDSHSSFYNGYDVMQPVYPEKADNRLEFFEGIRLGAVLAFSLAKEGSSEKGREKLFDLLKEIKKKDPIFFCFGEIDCRFHLLKQASIQGVPLVQIIENCIENYLGVVDQILSLGYRVGIVGVIPSTESKNDEYPSYGSMEDRNNCSKIFNQILESNCRDRRMPFVSLFDELVDKTNKTKLWYYFDRVHLSQLVMPLMIKKMRRLFPELINVYFSLFDIEMMILKSRVMLFFRYLKSKLVWSILKFN